MKASRGTCGGCGLPASSGAVRVSVRLSRSPPLSLSAQRLRTSANRYTAGRRLPLQRGLVLFFLDALATRMK